MFGKISKRSPTFCVFPWMEQVVQSNGKLSFCCVAEGGGMVKKENGKAYLAGQDKLSDAMNSRYMRDIRKAMLNGDQVEACRLCYYQESIGKRSYREMHNEEWNNRAPREIERRIDAASNADQVVSEPALYLDLRLGNLCNLKCRSCNPYNSSQIERETIDLLGRDADFAKVWTRSFGAQPRKMEAWFESDVFWDEVIESIPRLRKVYLTGGEPTLIEKNYKFLKACVDSGHSKNIFLMFNTNCTNLQERFFEYLKEFDFVLINASIDAIGDAAEYIRYLSRWKTVSENFERLLRLSRVSRNVQVGVTPVIQTYSVLNITDLLRYIELESIKCDVQVNVDFLYATHPEFIDVRFLPNAIKLTAIERLVKFRTESVLYGKERFLTNSVDSCINALEGSMGEVSREKLGEFLIYTSSLDKNRRQDIRTSLPELYAALAQEGFAI